MAGVTSLSYLIAALSVAGDPGSAGLPPIAPPELPTQAAPSSATTSPTPIEDALSAPDAAIPPVTSPEPEPAKGEAFEPPAREALPLGASRAASDTGADAEAPGAKSGLFGWGIVNTLASTGAVIGLILAGRWVMVRTARSPVGSVSVRSQLGAAGRAPSGLLFVLGRYPVARGVSLVLIQLDRRILLMSQSGMGFQTLAEITDPEEVASIIAKARDEEGESLSARFSALLRSFDRRHAESDRAESLRAVVRTEDTGASPDALDPDAPEPESSEAIRDRLSALRALVS